MNINTKPSIISLIPQFQRSPLPDYRLLVTYATVYVTYVQHYYENQIILRAELKLIKVILNNYVLTIDYFRGVFNNIIQCIISV